MTKALKLPILLLLLTALGGCGPSLWTLQDACRAGDSGACIVAQQRLQMLGMGGGMMVAGSTQLAQSTAPAPTPIRCSQRGVFWVCQ